MTRPVEPDADGHKIRLVETSLPDIELYKFETDVDDIISMLEDIRTELGEDFELVSGTDGDDNKVYEVYTYRYETDAERERRLLQEERWRQADRERAERDARMIADKTAWLEKTERAQLAALLEKYGPKGG